MSSLLKLCARPSLTEIKACWEITRLGKGLSVVPIPWFPYAFSAIMAYHAIPALSLYTLVHRAALFLILSAGVKALIMTIDDVLDHDIDARVTRTKGRAIPRGAITLSRAWLFFAMQVVGGVYLATKLLDTTTLKISMVSWPIFVLYPTCKRWMDFAPVPLGIMFNIGSLMGWTDVAPHTPIPWLMLSILYGALTFWTITYETVYQHQDKLDDAAIGSRSIALFLDKHNINTPIFAAVTSTLCLSLFCGAAYLNGQLGPPLGVGVAYAALKMYRPLPNLDVNTPAQCLSYFVGAGEPVGFALLAGLTGDAILRRSNSGVPL
ncbi:hypothetical protein EXIGLDRAFT_837645 [Exidia glandulosa HHB12029]|uniref:UbiA prenyltransferase n=1 Tax=Exidia glandulosa HHB12029 TaxID=1314781 RepID=A0A165GK14_EXIGL|nr:hypothetical protein EXIGLDRAFT_837645 [Exidia glandulosa HHB12029]